ncbi:hypothetical protein I4U23_030349 [Adineta vaga]|nr:hypothetical protein I4U23_030349 [Adineta vaga]
MAFRIHLLFITTILFLLSFYDANGFVTNQKQLRIASFSWQNCGPSSDPIQIRSLSVTPDPIQVPGNITIDLSVNVASTIPDDIHVAVTMERKVGGFFVKIPCIDNFGSCTYGDLCKDWAEVCPKYFEKYGIPCSCPIPPKTYAVQDASFPITGKLPSVSDGDYRITGDLASSTAHLGCIKLQIALKG